MLLDVWVPGVCIASGKKPAGYRSYRPADDRGYRSDASQFSPDSQQSELGGPSPRILRKERRRVMSEQPSMKKSKSWRGLG